MFTGIIDHLARIIALSQTDKGICMELECKFDSLIPGESIAVNGVCLTVIDPQDYFFKCDISPETLNLTNLSLLKLGEYVNVERSLALGDRLGGHFVYGHVDKTCLLKQKIQYGEFWRYDFIGLTKEDLPYFVKKGSVAVNGVSLTLNEISNDSFSVMIIPHTLERTNLGLLAVGDKVNIEFDWLTRIVVNRIEVAHES